jgi:hypothetical protein
VASDPKFAEIKAGFAKYLPKNNAADLPSVKGGGGEGDGGGGAKKGKGQGKGKKKQ